MNTKLIRFFNAALTNEEKVDPIQLNIKAAKVGYIVHPDCCTKSVQQFIDNEDININSTFYQSWIDIKNSDRESMFIDQLMHYASTYGMDFSGETYTKNPNPIKVEYNTYKIISPITSSELWQKCYNMICSGIALDSDTVQIICDYIIDELKNEEGKFNLDNIKNREAISIICHNLKIYPSNPVELLRYIVYETIQSPNLIKDKQTINTIKWKSNCLSSFEWESLSEQQLKDLSSIFYRFKEIFLAYKSREGKHNYIINRIRRYAKKYHKPMIKGILETILSNRYSEEEITNTIKSTTNFKIIQLIQSLRERLYILTYGGDDMYMIRNGKVYVTKKNHKESINDCSYLYNLHEMLYKQLVENLSKKSCIVKFPKNLNLTCPISEKKFIGNIPYGSYYEMDKHNFIGIYWKNEWGTHDFDLSFLDEDGNKYGWNSRYHNDKYNVMFSGDMTNADPEATEILYCDNLCPDGVIKVNRYNGVYGSKYKIFFGSQKINNLTRNYMVDPNCIKLEETIISKDSEQIIGYILNNKMYFMNFGIGDNIVSNKNEFTDIIRRKSKTNVDLKKLFMNAGFEEYNPEVHEKIDLDLTDLNKDTLINIFS